MKIKTNVFESGLIEQETLFNDHGLVGQMTRKLIDTSESQIREALIELGWTPPEKQEFKSFYMGTWEPSEKDNRLHQIAKQYHEETEAYDKTVCSAVNERGIAIPTNSDEQRSINRNALKVRERLVNQNLDVNSSEIRKAIRTYGAEHD